MGQCLTINIQTDGKLLANAYYHWGGYTSSSLHIANAIFESGLLADDFIKAIASPTQYAVKLLESTGAGYTGQDEGLIESEPKAMGNTNQWAETSIAIDLVTRKVLMNITWIAKDSDYSSEDYDKSSVLSFPFNFDECTFEEFPDLVDLYLNACSNTYPAIVHCPNGIIYRTFE